MIKLIGKASKAKITIETIDGTVYKKCDTPLSPLGNSENTVSFWSKNDLKILPMHQVKLVTFHFEEE